MMYSCGELPLISLVLLSVYSKDKNHIALYAGMQMEWFELSIHGSAGFSLCILWFRAVRKCKCGEVKPLCLETEENNWVFILYHYLGSIQNDF